MTDANPLPPNLEQLAQRFLALWQEQLALWFSDPALVAGGTQLLSPLLAMAAQGQGLWTDALDLTRASTKPPATGTAPAGAASQPSGTDIAQLADRVAALEARLAAMESGAGIIGGGPADRHGSTAER
jgi:hypothetical protein